MCPNEQKVADNWHQARLDHRTRQAESIAANALALIAEHGAPALTMAAIASAAGMSRQTLYRYYPDVDAVLVGLAELIASHDEHFEAQVTQLQDPATQLDLIVQTIIDARGHGQSDSAALRATLPPQARDVLNRHEGRIQHLLATVLAAGINEGLFRHDLEPSADAPLILGLIAGANPGNSERAVTLVHRVVDRQPEENTT